MIDTAIVAALEIVVLAQDGAEGVRAAGAPGAESATPIAPGGNGAPPPPAGGSLIFWLLPAMLIMMVMMTVMGNRKEKKRRAEMMSTIHKGAKVQPVGGLVGEVTEVADETVVIRSESSLARYSKSAIQQVLESRNKPQQVTEAKPGAQPVKV